MAEYILVVSGDGRKTAVFPINQLQKIEALPLQNSVTVYFPAGLINIKTKQADSQQCVARLIGLFGETSSLVSFNKVSLGVEDIGLEWFTA